MLMEIVIGQKLEHFSYREECKLQNFYTFLAWNFLINSFFSTVLKSVQNSAFFGYLY
jgi:hypothetical protein